MVGWLATGGDSTKADDYVKRVLPAVHIWRNKVGAHFAKVKPKKEDTPADLALSVMFPISLQLPIFSSPINGLSKVAT